MPFAAPHFADSDLGSLTHSPSIHSQLGTILLLLLIGQAVLCLGDLETTFTEQSHKADTEIGASKVKSEELSLLLAGRVLIVSPVSDA